MNRAQDSSLQRIAETQIEMGVAGLLWPLHTEVKA